MLNKVSYIIDFISSFILLYVYFTNKSLIYILAFMLCIILFILKISKYAIEFFKSEFILDYIFFAHILLGVCYCWIYSQTHSLSLYIFAFSQAFWAAFFISSS